MDSCYSGDHIAGDFMHTNITTCNIEEPQKKCRLGMVSNKLLVGRAYTCFTGSKVKIKAMVRN